MAWYRSRKKSEGGGGIQPPNFVKEYEAKGQTSSTFTVTTAGLYLLGAVVRWTESITITVNSANTSYSSNNLEYHILGYNLIDLDVGDTVTFATGSNSIHWVLRIENSTEFKSISTVISRDTAAVQSYTPTDECIYILFAGCYDDSHGDCDTSVIGTHSNSVDANYNSKAFLRAVGCLGDDSTINMYGNDYGAVVCLLIQMTIK